MHTGPDVQSWKPEPGAERFPFTSYPRGWFAVAWAGDIQPGTVMPERALGRDVVVLRTHSGRVGVLDAYCPHLGAHLGYGGEVDGEWLRCPFHAWAFDVEGRCTDVPLQSSPAQARCGTLATREVNGMLLAWFDPAGQSPPWEVTPVDEDGWTPLVVDKRCNWVVRTHPQEIIENSVDMAHLPVIHRMGVPEPLSRPTFSGPYYDVTLHTSTDGTAFGVDGAVRSTVESRQWGVGLIQVDSFFERLLPLKHRALIHITPLDHGHVHVRAALAVRRSDDPETDEMVLEEWTKGFAENFERDINVWEHKIYRPAPRLSRADGPVLQFRRWAAQFYE